jgi:hypothetical protein
LPPPPIDGPDVGLSDKKFDELQRAANAAPGGRYVECGVGLKKRRVTVNNQAVVDQLMAAHALVTIDKVYGTVFESVLGEKVSTNPVDVTSPFSWVDRAGNKAK